MQGLSEKETLRIVELEALADAHLQKVRLARNERRLILERGRKRVKAAANV